MLSETYARARAARREVGARHARAAGENEREERQGKDGFPAISQPEQAAKREYFKNYWSNKKEREALFSFSLNISNFFFE